MSVATDIQARGGRGGGGGFRGGGGGIRGGSSTSFGRGSDFGRGSFDRGSDSYRSGGTFSRSGDYSRSSRLDGNRSGSKLESNDRPLGGGSASQLPANRPGGGGSASQLPANRPGGIGGSASQLPANRPGEGTRWRPDCPKCSDGWDGWIDHPIAAGIAIGAIAGYRAAVGTYWYALPPECPPYIWNDYYYYSCNGTFFEPIYEGETIVYVSVPDPSGGSQPPTK
ncbi:hypothetical protein [Sphingomonas alba]|uniref:Uncharacterized protein n=1 Tax=Sphingomonas alba TaxID=2908208 RepID=A0ABT0RKN4_9SPHN|nr:hypothetical protein [Sphingomonas alba]MCL6683128.1 hypothetical protein [Sphingomonas alba]